MHLCLGGEGGRRGFAIRSKIRFVWTATKLLDAKDRTACRKIKFSLCKDALQSLNWKSLNFVLFFLCHGLELHAGSRLWCMFQSRGNFKNNNKILKCWCLDIIPCPRKWRAGFQPLLSFYAFKVVCGELGSCFTEHCQDLLLVEAPVFLQQSL